MQGIYDVQEGTFRIRSIRELVAEQLIRDDRVVSAFQAIVEPAEKLSASRALMLSGNSESTAEVLQCLVVLLLQVEAATYLIQSIATVGFCGKRAATAA